MGNQKQTKHLQMKFFASALLFGAAIALRLKGDDGPPTGPKPFFDGSEEQGPLANIDEGHDPHGDHQGPDEGRCDCECGKKETTHPWIPMEELLKVYNIDE